MSIELNFCPNCGKEVLAGTKICPFCKAEISEGRFLIGELEKHEISIRVSWSPRTLNPFAINATHATHVTVNVDGRSVIDTPWRSRSLGRADWDANARVIDHFSIGVKEKHEVRFNPPYSSELYVDGRQVRPTWYDSEAWFLTWQDIEALCDHLRCIGVEATVEPKEENLAVGSIRVANRNIDLVELKTWIVGGGEWEGVQLSEAENRYECTYMVQATVEGLKDGLVAQGEPVRKSIMSNDVESFEWWGKELAKTLNNDAILRNCLLSQGKPQPIKIYQEHSCVKISRKWGIFGSTGYRPLQKAFPTAETFEAFDRIAQHIRCIANAQQEETGEK